MFAASQGNVDIVLASLRADRNRFLNLAILPVRDHMISLLSRQASDEPPIENYQHILDILNHYMTERTGRRIILNAQAREQGTTPLLLSLPPEIIAYLASFIRY